MDETCGAAYLRLLALPPRRLLTGLRSADGACVPRCLLPPSPRHPGSENNQWLGFPLPAPSPLVTPAHRMLFRSPTSSSPWAPREPAAFWLSSCRDPSSAPESASLSRCLAAVPYPLFASPPRDTAGGRKQSIRAGVFPRRTGCRSAAGPSRCSAR